MSSLHRGERLSNGADNAMPVHSLPACSVTSNRINKLLSCPSRGFTLIELLIVVAIIAILAAIAIPNFLEAQVRAKVAAAKADLRTLATGVESYAVDHNRYPYTESIGPTIFMPAGGTPRFNPGNLQCGGITSPIAYITSIPNDTFKHPINGIPVSAPHYFESAGFQVNEGVFTASGPSKVPADAVGTSKLDGIGPDTDVTSEQLTPRNWIFYSLGPDLDNNVTVNGTLITASRWNLANRYDPTNGTVSAGNILRLPGGQNLP